MLLGYKKAILVCAGCVALFFLAKEVFFGGDERRIREVLTTLAESVKKEGASEGPMATVSKESDFESCFSEEVSFEIPFLHMAGSKSRTEIAKQVFASRMMLDSLSIEFHDIKIAKRNSSAHVSGTIWGSWIFRRGGSISDACEIDIDFSKESGKWRIRAATAKPILRK